MKSYGRSLQCHQFVVVWGDVVALHFAPQEKGHYTLWLLCNSYIWITSRKWVHVYICSKIITLTNLFRRLSTTYSVAVNFLKKQKTCHSLMKKHNECLANCCVVRGIKPLWDMLLFKYNQLLAGISISLCVILHHTPHCAGLFAFYSMACHVLFLIYLLTTEKNPTVWNENRLRSNCEDIY